LTLPSRWPLVATSKASVALRWLLRELTERKQAEAELLHNAFHDALTGLLNRALLLNLLEQAIEFWHPV